MSFSSLLHKIVYRLLKIPVPTIRLGKRAAWNLDVRGLNESAFVLSAGAGHDISFELDLVERTGCRLLLLDPSPTGLETVGKFQLPQVMSFEPKALSARSGMISMARPLNSAEGSWRLGADGEGDEMPSTTLAEIMKSYSIEKMDLLKIDIEGFEYQVLEDLLRRKLPVKQICVEIHQGVEFEKTRIDRWKLIFYLYQSGYRLIHHSGWDHTFLHKSALMA
jgi:FkbM family methyltransferase